MVTTAAHPEPSAPSAPPPPELTPRDREWLTLYLDSSEDLQALAARLASTAAAGPSSSGQSPVASCQSPSLLALAAWLRTPAVRAALADWDYAQRRARAARDEADRRIAIDALKAVCLSCHRPCHRDAPSGDSLPASTAPNQHAGADPPSTSASSASSAAASEFAQLVEVRRAATTILRTLSGAMATPARRGEGRRGYGRRVEHRARESSPSQPRRPRRISDFTFSDPADAERLLDRERRENDRLEKLIQKTLAMTGGDDAEPSGTPSLRDGSEVSPADNGPPAPPPTRTPTVTEIMRDYRSAQRARADARRDDRRAAHLAAAAGHTLIPNTS